MSRLLIHNADIITMNETNPFAEAVLIDRGKIVKAGTLEEVRQVSGSRTAETLDLGGQTVIPGFIDGHSHFSATAVKNIFADLSAPPVGKCGSIGAMIAILSDYGKTLKKNEMIIGMGYDESSFAEKRIPSRYDLDKVSETRPVCAIHASGHCAVVNSYAIEHFELKAGNGVISDSRGELTGELQEAALFEVQGKMKGAITKKLFSAIGKVSELYVENGITTAQDGLTEKGTYYLLRFADFLKKIPIDVVCYCSEKAAETLLSKEGPEKNKYKNHIRAAGLKILLDGSPQAKTAWLSRPYHIPPKGKDADYCGFPAMSDDKLDVILMNAIQNNWQVNAHTNGDAAIEQLISCYERVAEKLGKGRDLRPVSIHCQTARMDQLDRIKELGMMPSFFLDHVFFWGDWHRDSVLGAERAEHISPLKSSLDRGIKFSLHQDSPVTKPEMIRTIHNAVNRVTKEGKVLGEAEKINPYEALKAVTVNAAEQIFEEKTKGSLTPGKYADLAVLDRNPLHTPAEKLKQIQVVKTIKEGKIIYER